MGVAWITNRKDRTWKFDARACSALSAVPDGDRSTRFEIPGFKSFHPACRL
jgi:hypothetical protein